jgi:hypothetical protein
MKSIENEIKSILKSQVLDPNNLIEFMSLENLIQMRKVSEITLSNTLDDISKVQSKDVKSIIFEDYQKISNNVKVIRYAIRFYGFGFSSN